MIEQLLLAGADDMICYRAHQRAIEEIKQKIYQEQEIAKKSCFKFHHKKAEILQILLNKALAAHKNIANELLDPNSDLFCAMNKPSWKFFTAPLPRADLAKEPDQKSPEDPSASPRSPSE